MRSLLDWMVRAGRRRLAPAIQRLREWRILAGYAPWIMRPAGRTVFLGSGRWDCDDADPHILVSPSRGRLRDGLYQIRFSRTPPWEVALRPRVYVDCGNGFTEADAVQFPAIATAVAQFYLWLPRGIHALRIDPVSKAGSFTLDEIALRRVSVVRAMAHLALRHRHALPAVLRGFFIPPVPATGLKGVAAATLRSAQGDYGLWVKRYDRGPGLLGRRRAKAYLDRLKHQPLVSVVMAAHDSNEQWLDAAIGSVRRQLYANWELCIVDDASTATAPARIAQQNAAQDHRVSFRRRADNGGIAAATNTGIEMAAGDWIAFLDHDDMLHAEALALVVAAINEHPNALILYSDEDKIDEDNHRFEPYFKGDWNRELFYGQNYLNHLTVVRGDLVREVGGLRPGYDGSQDYDLLLRCIEHAREDQIVHIPHVCYHWRFARERVNFSMTQADRSLDAGHRALQDHFDRAHVEADADLGPNGYHRAVWRLPDDLPSVSLIIPTRDHVDLLARAVDSILAAPAYPKLDLIIADNESADPATRRYLKGLEETGRARVVPAPGAFNFSRINNIAARASTATLVGFVNNDIVARNPEWLWEMVRHFTREDVAAVGAKLLYGDGTIQHAGVVTGIGGIAGHLYKGRRGDDPGPFNQLLLAREVQCVTAACMLARRSAFDAVGGFDENLAVAFNDIDLCLRLRAAGGRIVWTPRAALDHRESVSRGSDLAGESLVRFGGEIAKMKAKWGALLQSDPYYNPNLTLADESGAVAFPPRAMKPWFASARRRQR